LGRESGFTVCCLSIGIRSSVPADGSTTMMSSPSENADQYP
jgi:hypothetical protein